MAMELNITTDLTTAIPSEISFNFEELKTELAERLDHYNHLVITDDSIQEGRADRAKLNALVKALDERRKEVKKACLAPYEAFEAQVKELIALVKAPIAAIDKQLDAYEEQRRAEKEAEIKAVWDGYLADNKVPAGITLSAIYDPKWLNATVSISTVKKTMGARFEQIAKDLAVIEGLTAYNFEAKETYLDTLDLGKAISEAHRLTALEQKRKEWEAEQERRKAAQEAARATETVQPTVSTPEVQTPAVEAVAPQEEAVEAKEEPVYILRLEMHVTKSQAADLKAFLIANKIVHNKI